MIDFLLGVPGKLKTIADYMTTNLSPTRAAKIDNADVATSTRAPASTALSTATWTAAMASTMFRVKSLQNVSVTIGATSTSTFDTTVSAVDTAKTIILICGKAFGSGEDPLSAEFKFTLTSSTNLRAQRGSNVSVSGSYQVQLIEFY